MLAQFNSETGVTFMNTTVATMAAMLGWLLVERILHGKATSLGAASGVVAGLVAITPSCGAVDTLGAMVIGAVAGVRLRLRGRPEVQASASTTRSTSSASTWSAASSARC